MIVDKALEQRAVDGRPIGIAMAGAGYMGRGIARHVTQNMPGLRVLVIINRTIDHALEAYRIAGFEDVAFCEDLAALNRAIALGIPAVTSRPELACLADAVEVVIEATGEVEFGLSVVDSAITAGRHVVLVNAELDATVGPILKTKADAQGVVLTNADGDEPGVAMNLVRLVRSIGYRPVLAGNVKGFLNPHRNPDTQRSFAERHGQRPKMITSFADGTKLSMESTVLANATGFGVTRMGMTGASIPHVREILSVYDLEALLANPVVDYVLGAEPGSGAFVVAHNPDPFLGGYMDYFKMGPGPFHVFYRPFHLTHLEAPLSAARAALFHDATITPKGAPVAEVVALAKIDLNPGDELDGIGGFTNYGMIENTASARAINGLPMGLSHGARMLRSKARDEVITLDDVELPSGSRSVQLWREQASHFRLMA